MFRRFWLVSTSALFLAVAPARAGTAMLDLIPRDAAAGLAVRNIADFKKKADKLISDIEPNMRGGATLLFTLAYEYLGIKGGVDEDNAAAAVLVSPKTVGQKELSARFEELLVLVVPFANRDRMAWNFGFKAGQLKPDQMAEAERAQFGRFFYARAKHLYVGNNEKAVVSVAKGKPLGAELAADRRKALNDADALIHVSPHSLDQGWTRMLKNVETYIDKNAGKEEQSWARQLVQALAAVQHAIAAVRLDGGVGISFLALFPKEGSPEARKLLKALAEGGAPARLAGLPRGNVLAALASGSDGTRNAPIARAFLNMVLHNGEVQKLISPADRPLLAGLFTEVWQRLRGGRTAVYQNAEDGKVGLFSVVAILDTDDAPQFIADLRELAQIADGTALDLSTKTGRGIAGPRVEALVRDLGNRRFRVRQSATTKLRLLGEPALPYLARAVNSSDVEIVERARRLRKEIESAAAQRRKELLDKGLPRLVKPTFRFVAKAETRGGHSIDVVNVKLAAEDTAFAPQLKALFGPSWDKIRLATHGKQVIVLLGSDVRLLEETLANLQDGKPGLAEWKALAAFDRQRHPARRFELHISVARALALVLGRRLDQPAMTSTALTLQPDLVQVDVRLSTADIKAMVQASRVR
jgi:hypothetical protein